MDEQILSPYWTTSDLRKQSAFYRHHDSVGLYGAAMYGSWDRMGQVVPAPTLSPDGKARTLPRVTRTWSTQRPPAP